MSNRDYYFDNAKFLLIFLVVLGHLITPYINHNEYMSTLYKWIYLFHMPAFILIAGYFSKGFRQKGYILKITKKILIPYLLFQTIYSVYYFYLYDRNDLVINPFKPHWSLWFLLSLFLWHLLLYLFTRMDKKYAFSLAIGLGILVGYLDIIPNYVSFFRTFVFFPIFLLGHYLNKNHFERYFLSMKKATSVITLILIMIGLHYLFPDFHKEWLYGSKTYAELGMEGLEAGLIRALFYCLSMVTAIAFLSLVPSKKFSFTTWGTRTMYIYLLHGFVIRFLAETPFPQFIKETNTYILILALAVSLSILLASKPIIRIAQPLIELRLARAK